MECANILSIGSNISHLQGGQAGGERGREGLCLQARNELFGQKCVCKRLLPILWELFADPGRGRGGGGGLHGEYVSAPAALCKISPYFPPVVPPFSHFRSLCWGPPRRQA